MNVVPFNPPLHLSDRDKILASLKTMITEIEDGTVSPSYMMYFLGETVEIDGQAGTAYAWDAIGLNFYEIIGHLTTYINLLTSKGPE